MYKKVQSHQEILWLSGRLSSLSALLFPLVIGYFLIVNVKYYNKYIQNAVNMTAKQFQLNECEISPLQV